jgi:transposase InsO family protein
MALLRFDRLLVADNGLEFYSTALDSVAMDLGMTSSIAQSGNRGSKAPSSASCRRSISP